MLPFPEIGHLVGNEMATSRRVCRVRGGGGVSNPACSRSERLTTGGGGQQSLKPEAR